MRAAGLAALAWLGTLVHGSAAGAPLRLEVERAFVGEAPGTDQPVLDLRLSLDSAKAFAAFTANSVGKVVELYIDGKVVFAPTVRDPIRSGEVEISGQFSRLELLEAANRIWRGTAVVEVATRD
jgi:preprotein translocase subunit SecD